MEEEKVILDDAIRLLSCNGIRILTDNTGKRYINEELVLNLLAMINKKK